MRAALAGIIAGIEALAVALATMLVVTGMAFLIWGVSFGLEAEPSDVLGIAGAVWLLAHCVPLAVELTPETMQAFGFTPEALSFTLSLAPLGITLVTVAFAARSGWRFGLRGGSGVAGVIGGVIAFGGAAALIGSFVSLAALPVAAVAAVPAALYGVSSAFAFVLRSAREEHLWWLRVVETLEAGVTRLGAATGRLLVVRAAAALRLAAMLVLTYLGVAAIATSVALILGFADVTAASQSLQLGAWGLIMMFVLQLVLLPNVVMWAGSWLSGAGFALGSGTSVSSFGALLGPVPAVPVLAAVPDGWGSLAVGAPVLLALAALGVGGLLGKFARQQSLGALCAVVFGAAIVAGLGVALLAWVSGGSAGPGRLHEVGPEPWVSGGLAAAELGLGALLGALAARADLVARLARVAPMPSTRGSSDTAGPDWEDGSVAGEAARSHLAAVDPDEQPTVPVEFDLPVIPRAEDVADVADSAGVADDGLTDAGDLQATDVIADDQLPAPAVYREPELFDQQEAEVAASPEPEDPADSHEASVTGSSTGLDPASLDPDALIEAYSWDSPPASEPEIQKKRSNWRWRHKRQ